MKIKKTKKGKESDQSLTKPPQMELPPGKEWQFSKVKPTVREKASVKNPISAPKKQENGLAIPRGIDECDFYFQCAQDMYAVSAYLNKTERLQEKTGNKALNIMVHILFFFWYRVNF